MCAWDMSADALLRRHRDESVLLAKSSKQLDNDLATSVQEYSSYHT